MTNYILVDKENKATVVIVTLDKVCIHDLYFLEKIHLYYI
jgi:hypothetical protein